MSSGIWDWATWAFGAVCLCCPTFQNAGLLVIFTVLGFLRIQLPPWELSPSRPAAVLGLHLTGLSRGSFSWIISESRHQISQWHQECVISSVLSHHCKDLKRRTSVTARWQLRVLFCKQRKVHPWGVRAARPQRRDSQSVLASTFYKFCLLLSEPALCKLG